MEGDVEMSSPSHASNLPDATLTITSQAVALRARPQQVVMTDVDFATAEIRNRLRYAYDFIEHRVHEAKCEEIRTASEVFGTVHAVLRQEASEVREAMNSTLHSHQQVLQAEAMLEGKWGQMQLTEQRMFQTGFTEAAVHANAAHDHVVRELELRASFPLASVDEASAQTERKQVINRSNRQPGNTESPRRSFVPNKGLVRNRCTYSPLSCEKSS